MKRTLRALLIRSVITVILVTATVRLVVWQIYEHHEASQPALAHSPHAELRELLLVVTVEFFALIVLGVMLGRLVTTILRPLREIATTARWIADGRLDRRIETATLPEGELFDIASTLNQSFDQYRDALDRVGRFSSSASHQLRRPLTSMRAAAELCLSKECTPAEVQEALSTVLEESTHLDRLIAQLLLLARLDAPALRSGFQDLDLNTIVTRAMEYFDPLVSNNSIRVQVQLCAQAPLVGDATLLTEVVTNILDNAIKVTPVGGWLDVETRYADNVTRLSIADSGPGISPQFRGQLFARFSRDPATSYSGSGLGLAIVTEVVHAHGGSVDVQPNAYGGTTFCVRIPSVQPTRAPDLLTPPS